MGRAEPLPSVSGQHWAPGARAPAGTERRVAWEGAKCSFSLRKSKADLFFQCSIVFDEEVLQLSLPSAALLRIFDCLSARCVVLPKLHLI